MRGRKINYTEAELTWLKSNCKLDRVELHKKFCRKFGRNDISKDNIKSLCSRNGWATGRTGCFVKDHTPANKGKKMPYNANTAKTQFKKGRTPHNTKHAGHERVTKDGYIEVSVNETNPHTGFERRYVLKHRHLWEKVNGPLPEGMCLKCLNGDRQNTAPDNWEAIHKGVRPFLNGLHGLDYETAPDDIKPVALTLAKLKYARSKQVRKDS